MWVSSGRWDGWLRKLLFRCWVRYTHAALTKSQPEMLPGSKPCISIVEGSLRWGNSNHYRPKNRLWGSFWQRKWDQQFCIAVNSRNCFRPACEDMNVHFFIRQSSPRQGCCAGKSFVNNEPFIVALVIQSSFLQVILLFSENDRRHHGNPSAMIIGTRVVPRGCFQIRY